MTANDACWATFETSWACVTHGKERASLSKALERLFDRCGSSYSAALGNDVRQAMRRMFNKEAITQQGLLAGHVSATAVRIREAKPSLLLVPSDTTEYNFTGHPSTKDLGPLRQNQLGFLAHEAIAVSDEGTPLGLLHVDMWRRTEMGTRDDKRKKPYTEKESYKWARVIPSIEQSLDPDQQALLIQDREADVFAFVAEPRASNIHLLIRASEPRRVEVVTDDDADVGPECAREPAISELSSNAHSVDLDQTNKQCLLFDAIAQVKPKGTYSFMVPRRADQDLREAILEVRYTPMTLLAPLHRHKEDPSEPQSVWVVQVRETKAPEGVSPVEWTLISTMPVTTVDEARAMVVRYSRRWLIERLHYTLKSGCNVERLQLDDFDSLTKAMCLYYIVAWRMLYMTYLAREDDSKPASTVLTADELTVLVAASKRPILTIADAIVNIAKLGGYTFYKKAPPPGVKVLWLGWRKLDAMVEGFLLFKPNIRYLMNQA